MFRIQQLQYFMATIEKGSLNQAAKALYISQPALTKQLNLLEKEWNCRLLIRKRTGVEVTEAGRYLYEKASLILEQIEQLEAGVKRFTETPQLRIGALPSLATYYLPTVMEDLQNRLGYTMNIAIRDTTHELIQLLEQDEIDVAFVQDWNPHPTLLSHFLFREAYVIILPTNHPLAKEVNVEIQQLMNEKWILHKDPCDIRTAFRRFCNQLGLEPTIALELEFNESLLTFARKGYGITIIPNMIAAEIQDPLLCVKRMYPDTLTRTIDVVYHAERKDQIQQILIVD